MFDQQTSASGDLKSRLADLHEDAWRWAVSCCRGDAETATEALQDAYLAILGGKARFAGRSAFKSFVFGVIRNCARSARRRNTVRDFFFAPIEAAETIGQAGEQENAVDAGRAEEAIAALSPRQREAAQLVLIYGFSVSEAAEAMGVSRGSASRHYAEAKKRLRGALLDGEATDER